MNTKTARPDIQHIVTQVRAVATGSTPQTADLFDEIAAALATLDEDGLAAVLGEVPELYDALMAIHARSARRSRTSGRRVRNRTQPRTRQ